LEGEGDLLEVYAKYRDLELRFRGKPEEVVRVLLKFVQRILPAFDLASKITLTVDLEGLIENVEGIIAFTPEGPVVTVSKERLGGDKGAIMLHLIKAYIGHRTGRLDKDTLASSEIKSLIGVKSSTVAARLSELVSSGWVERVGRGEYRITTLGIKNFLDEVLPKIEAGEGA